jgi:C_GCAxxG_C_C family probable redox protein
LSGEPHRAASTQQKEKMKSRSEIAVSKFMDGYNCAQSVFYSFCDDLRFEKDSALKLACGFGAGMGRKEEVCGAVSGGIMAIGAKYGRGEKADQSATETTYKKTRELMDRFALKQGTFICRKLLGGCELTTEEGHRKFKETDLRTKVCAPCVRSAVEILESILNQD